MNQPHGASRPRAFARAVALAPALSPALDTTVLEFTTAETGRVAYYEGRPDTPNDERPLLLIHSLNAAPSAFEVKPLFEAFRWKRPVYVIDLPGFGLSERGPRNYTTELYAAAILEMIRIIDAPAVDVVALSLAAELAARAALLKPEAFASLSLISPTGFGTGTPPGGSTSDRVEKIFNLPLLGTGFFRLVTGRKSIAFFANKAFVREAPEDFIEYAYQSARQEGAKFAPFAFLCGKLFSQDAIQSLYGRLETPTLVIYDEDANLTFERIPEWVDQGPDRYAERIRPTLGLPHWDELETTVDRLEAFWRD